jgi:transposase-like protein
MKIMKIEKLIEQVMARRELIQKHQPKCPHCRSEQVQIMSHRNPAEWRCRNCKFWFNFEPTNKQ